MAWRPPQPETWQVRELSAGWELAGCAPGACADPAAAAELDWIPATVPGTVAAAIDPAGDWRTSPAPAPALDEQDWWFRVRLQEPPPEDGEQLVLALDGLATVTEVYLDGRLIHESRSMFARHEIDVGESLRGANELAVCCRALAPLLRERRRPRARWRTRLVAEGNLRFFRTMLLGRAPGFAPGPAVVGPFRPVRLERRRGLAVDELQLRPRLAGEQGTLCVSARLRVLAPGAELGRVLIELSGPSGSHRTELSLGAEGRVRGELIIDRVAAWWPHTHGDPALYDARLLAELSGREQVIGLGRVGFRRLRSQGALARDGLSLEVNDVPVFARGAVWTPLDLAAPHAPEAALRSTLERVVDAGMNMLRVPGIGCYESDAFYDLADELGILIWQDFMFANLDYPDQDPAFMAEVQEEADAVMAALAPRPSLAVLCGGSEVAQQVAMTGLDPELANGPLYTELLPAAVERAGVDVPYIPSTPWGGELPFRPDRGVAHYYGVGAYLRPLEDARRAEVKFASECLAFANVPDQIALEALAAPGGTVVHHPAWKAGVPRDAGAGWDFEDVRDHYLGILHGVDPVGLRSIDHARYLELSRTTSGEVMAETIGEWRRGGSPCTGAIILWLSDLRAGAGWGLLDHRGEPKVALAHLRRALAPVAVWSTDEGLGGVAVHVANDGAERLVARLRVALYRDFELRVEEIETELELEPHSGATYDVEGLLGRFVDLSWAYRFGAPGQNLIVLSLETEGPDGTQLRSQAFRMPAGRPSEPEHAARLGLEAQLAAGAADTATLVVTSRRFAYGVRPHVPGFAVADDAFCVEPGHTRVIALRRIGPSPAPDAEGSGASLTAINLAGRVRIAEGARG